LLSDFRPERKAFRTKVGRGILEVLFPLNNSIKRFPCRLKQDRKLRVLTCTDTVSTNGCTQTFWQRPFRNDRCDDTFTAFSCENADKTAALKAPAGLWLKAFIKKQLDELLFLLIMT